jgi:hypothetical protein
MGHLIYSTPLRKDFGIAHVKKRNFKSQITIDLDCAFAFTGKVLQEMRWGFTIIGSYL